MRQCLSSLASPCNGAPADAHPTNTWQPCSRRCLLSPRPHHALSPSHILGSVSFTSLSHYVAPPLPDLTVVSAPRAHRHSSLSIFSCHLARADMVPCLCSLIGVQFNLICIQFIYWVVIFIRFHLLDSYLFIELLYCIRVLLFGFVWVVYHVGGGDTNQGKENYERLDPNWMGLWTDDYRKKNRIWIEIRVGRKKLWPKFCLFVIRYRSI